MMRQRPSSLRQPRPARRARGFSLAEVLVALVLLSGGALSVVAASAMAIRSNSAAAAEIAATSAARHRVELLAAGACRVARDTAGADSASSIRESWSIRVARNATRVVTDSVSYDDRFGRHSLALHRLATC
jgi:prepilin-type N-terminal cleavage/methylation domain-containing protein